MSTAHPMAGNDFSAFAAAQTLRVATPGGSHLHYQDRGTGPVVLLGHSYLWDSGMWEPQIQLLSRHYRVIAPDLWGHGASGPLPGGTSDLRTLAMQMLDLLDTLQIEEFAVIGLSVGGMWGAELAALAPSRVRSLVMMDTYLGTEPEVTRQRYFGMLDAIEAAGCITAPLVEAIAPIFFHPGTDPRSPLPAEFAKRLAAMPADRLRDSVVPLGRLIFGRDDALGLLSGLDPATTLLMCGDGDIPRPPHEMQRMAEIIGCEAILVPDAGHISNLENPEAVNGHLRRWLERTLR